MSVSGSSAESGSVGWVRIWGRTQVFVVAGRQPANRRFHNSHFTEREVTHKT